MFGSEVLELAVGLVFVYILLSLFSTTLTELIARFMALRSTTLEEGIRNLLSDQSGGVDIADKFYAHPLIAKLGLKEKGLLPGIKRGLPSYISSYYFTLALYDSLFPENPESGPMTHAEVREVVRQLPPSLKQPLFALLGEANGDLKAFRKGIENWFDEIMERIDGWYTRKTQVITICIAIVVAIIFNADTIMMANTLLQNSNLRDAIVATASQIDPGEQELAEELSKLQTELLGTGIVGWLPRSDDYVDPREFPTSAEDVFLKVAGLLLTAGLVSLGAPFWFDILNKVSNIRATGAPPATKDKGLKDGEVKLRVT